MKQIIVIRKDLKMRRGKEIAQSCHASIAFLTNKIKLFLADKINNNWVDFEKYLTEEEIAWIYGIFTKVCVCVDSEKELLSIYEKAQEANLNVHIITDNGLTEFHGVPTPTCLCIGPHANDKFNGITSNLRLY